MILIITNQLDQTTDMVIKKLENRNTKYIRFNTEKFPIRAKCKIEMSVLGVTGYLAVDEKRKVSFDEITSVYYRRPKQHIVEKLISQDVEKFAQNESTATTVGLWMALNTLWVNHPHKIKAAEYKIGQLQIASKVGLQVPKTLITNKGAEVLPFFEKCGNRMIVKPISRGVIETSEQAIFIYTNRVLKEHLESVSLVDYAPCLFQEYVPKNIEVRVTIVGHRTFAAEIHSQNNEKTRDDWRHYNPESTPHYPHQLPREIEEKCLKLLSYYDLNYGAFDFILTPEGQYVFLEINPNGQWGWIEVQTGLPISDAIAELLCDGIVK